MFRPFARQRCFFLGNAFLPEGESTILATNSWAFSHENPSVNNDTPWTRTLIWQGFLLPPNDP